MKQVSNYSNPAIRKGRLSRLIAVLALVFVVAVSGLVYANPNKAAADAEAHLDAPWYKTSETTGNYIYDGLKDYGVTIPENHVFENVTQERLLDILASSGDYYILFGGPEHEATQKVAGDIDRLAKANSISKIYVFDPYFDGYQLDSTVEGSGYKSGNQDIFGLWTRITDTIGSNGGVFDAYEGSDALLFRYNKANESPLAANYTLAEDDVVTYISGSADTAITDVFKDGGGNVIPASVRTSLEFFKRVFNTTTNNFNYYGNATKLNDQGQERPQVTSSETPGNGSWPGEEHTAIQAEDEANFDFQQISFPELLNLYRTPGEHIILYAASWCGNTAAIFESVVDKAVASERKVYVYDTTLGNQLTWSDRGLGDVVIAQNGSSNYNTRQPGTTNHTVSYVYAEAVRPLKGFTTENHSSKNNSIAYQRDGILANPITTIASFADEAANADPYTVNARRLQLPFLVTYKKSETEPVTKQWLQKKADFATTGAFAEYMLYGAWVQATAKAQTENNRYGTGLSDVAFGAAGVAALNPIFVPLTVDPVEYNTLDDFITYTGKGEVVWRIDAPLTDFYKLERNGVEVPTNHYTTAEGSTIITLKDIHLQALENGSHAYKAHFTLGTASTTLTVNKASEPVKDPVVQKAGTSGDTNTNSATTSTGDAGTFGLVVIVALIGTILAIVAIARRRFSKSKASE